MEILAIALISGIAAFALVMKAGLWAINTLESHKRDLEAAEAAIRRSDYQGPRFNAHGREVI